MRNIIEIFKMDFSRIKKNVIAIVVVMGMCVLPCLYAWFNIAACWDPYQNTGNLKVAIASEDEGYSGDIIPMHVNIGEQIVSKLRANTKMDWNFVSKDKALEGVRSGTYYAAIVIPEDFTDKMMSIFSLDIQKPEIIYYVNDKENAIAPKVTDKGATGIQTEINEVFTETITETVLNDLQAISNLSEESGEGNIADNFSNNLKQIATNLTLTADTLDAFAQMSNFAESTLNTTSEFLKTTQKDLTQDINTINSNSFATSNLQQAIDGSTDSINNAIDNTKDFYNGVNDIVRPVLVAEKQAGSDASYTLNNASDNVGSMIDNYQDLKDSVAKLAEANPDLSDQADKVQKDLDDTIAAQKSLKNLLDNASSYADTNLANGDTSTPTASNAKNLQSTYESNLKKYLDNVVSSLKTAQGDLVVMLEDLDDTLGDLYSITTSASGDLSNLGDYLSESATQLRNTASGINKTCDKLQEIKDSKDFSIVDFLLSSDTESVSTFLASPVQLDTIEYYEVANYGSAMAPFYSALAIWIGGIVLAALMKIKLPQSYKDALPTLKPYQAYLGRYAMFLIMGLIQVTLIFLGDLFFLGIQCEHPWLFMLAGWFSSVVFVNIIYTLTSSFGDIGKAGAVVLLVMQVAGSGGVFPIEVTPKFFQIVYPLLPFTHSMAAMRECIGGMYGMTYWIQMAELGIFLVISIIVGMILRNPVAKSKGGFTKSLEETRLM